MPDDPTLEYLTPRRGRFPWGQAVVVLFCGLILAGLLLLFVRYGLQRELRRREVCADNLRRIVLAMQVYSVDNVDTFPLIPNTDGMSTYTAPYPPPPGAGGTYVNDPGTLGRITATTDPEVEIHGSYNGGVGASSGAASTSPTRCLWILVLRKSLTPRTFLCPSDRFVTGPAPVTDAAGRYYGNFQSTSISYSVPTPWGTVQRTSGAALHWKNTTASDMPAISDMAPEHGTGLGAQLRNTTAPKGSPGSPQIYSSPNHGGQGQNVAYADGHVEWTTDPYVGQSGDNIWTRGGDSFVTSGGVATVRGCLPTSQSGFIPDDTPFIPVRNVATGGM